MFRNALRMGASSMLIRVPQMMQLKLPFFTQPSNRLAMTLPAFRASRIDLDVIE